MNLFDYFTPKSETYYIDADSTIRQALEKFDYYKFTVVPMVDEEGRYVTTVSAGDILRFVKNDAKFDIAAAENVRVMDIDRYRAYEPCTCDVSMNEVIRLSLQQNFVPVVDDRGLYIGIIKRKAVLGALCKENGIEI